MVTRKKKRFVVFLLVALGFAALLTGALSPRTAVANAEEAPPPVLYRYFADNVAIGADNEFVYLADDVTVYLYSAAQCAFDEKVIAAGQSVTAIAAGSGKLYTTEGNGGSLAVYTVADGSRAVPDFKTAPDSGYTGLAVLNDCLYAVRGKTLVVFDAGLVYQKTVTAAQDILGVAAGKDKLYVVVKDGRNAAVYSLAADADKLSDKAFLIVNEPFEGAAFFEKENLLTVFTAGNILLVDGETEAQRQRIVRTDNNAYGFAAGANAFFTVNNDNSISEFSADFKTEILRIAAAANKPGFYNMPSDLASRNGKIYVADRLNDRVSIQSGTVFTAIEARTQAVSVAADPDGFVYVAYNSVHIAKYNAAGTLVNDPDAVPYRFTKTISLIRADSQGNLYVLDTDNYLYKLAPGATEFTSVYQNPDGTPGKVYGMSAGLNNPDFYIAVRVNAADEHPKKILHVTETGFSSTGIENITGFIDMSADADGGIYVLKKDNAEYLTLRYDYHKTDGIYTPNAQTVTLIGYTSPVRISVSAVDVADGAGYRDILVADAALHTVSIIPCGSYGIDPDIQKTPPVLDGGLPTADVFNTAHIIRRVVNADGCALMAGPADVYPVRRFTSEAKTASEDVRLPNGYRLIVPHYDPDSDYSFVIADNTKYEPYDLEILTGFVRNKYLSEPFEYTAEHPAKCAAKYDNGTPVYKYPALQAPILSGFESVAKGTVFNFLDFVYDQTGADTGIGYYDNRATPIRWYRISFADDGKLYEGFVDADSVTVNGFSTESGTQLKSNAVIIADAGDNRTGAAVYLLNDVGEYVLDPMCDPLPVGKRIWVEGAFDSSNPYTKVSFQTDYGVIRERYVKTVRIQYDGINLLQIIAIGVIILASLLVLILIVWRLKKRRRYDPKKLDTEHYAEMWDQPR